MFEHKWNEHDGFTADDNCDRLVCFEGHEDIARAIAREKQLKGWRREKKIVLSTAWFAYAINFAQDDSALGAEPVPIVGIPEVRPRSLSNRG